MKHNKLILMMIVLLVSFYSIPTYAMKSLAQLKADLAKAERDAKSPIPTTAATAKARVVKLKAQIAELEGVRPGGGGAPVLTPEQQQFISGWQTHIQQNLAALATLAATPDAIQWVKDRINEARSVGSAEVAFLAGNGVNLNNYLTTLNQKLTELSGGGGVPAYPPRRPTVPTGPVNVTAYREGSSYGVASGLGAGAQYDAVLQSAVEAEKAAEAQGQSLMGIGKAIDRAIAAATGG
jgi:hypothetical protein